MSEENVEVVQRMLAAFNCGDVPAVLDTFDEDCQLEEPGEMPDSPVLGFRGHEGIRRWMANLRDVGGVEFQATSFTAAGDVVFSEWLASGLGQASHAPMEWRTFAVIHLRGGRILRARGFLDRDEALTAAGLSSGG